MSYEIAFLETRIDSCFLFVYFRAKKGLKKIQINSILLTLF